MDDIEYPNDCPNECISLTYFDDKVNMANDYFFSEELYYEFESFVFAVIKNADGVNDDTDETVCNNFGYYYTTAEGMEIAHSGDLTYEQALLVFQKAQDYEDLGEIIDVD